MYLNVGNAVVPPMMLNVLVVDAVEFNPWGVGVSVLIIYALEGVMILLYSIERADRWAVAMLRYFYFLITWGLSNWTAQPRDDDNPNCRPICP